MARRRSSTTWRRVAGVAAALAMLTVAGCGGDDDDAGPAAGVSDDAGSSGSDDDGGDDDGGFDDSDGTDGASGDGSGDGSGDAGGDDFPIPAPDGLVLDALADAGITSSGQRQLYYDDDDYDRVVEFFDEWTSQNGEWARGEALGTVTYQSLDVDVIRTISISPDHDPGAQADGPVTFVLLVADG